MKKLVSVWIESEKVEEIKREHQKSVSDFIREAVLDNLDKKAFKRGKHSFFDVNAGIFCLKNNIPLLFSNYVDLLIAFDGFYTGEVISEDLVSNHQTKLFATVTAKILGFNFYERNILEHPARYFLDYIIPSFDKVSPHQRINYHEIANLSYGFESYVSCVIHLGAENFCVLGLIRALEVFMRDEALEKDSQTIATICSSLNPIFLSLAEHIVKSSPDTYGFPYSKELLDLRP